MSQRQTTHLGMVGGIVALVGGIVSLVYLLQPWRTCPGEDSPTACAMLPLDAVVMTIAILATIVGVAVFVLGLAKIGRA
ncbi:hypothetical protein [Agromyces humatus]|uniref:Uncharacterized protein n=1 Tax=Agromyces humatus TaxID=279573 RepID=A0ABP4WLF9_9MICO|nr:hypothetical protein [Agromyces humatus]